jgi:hypothetical protein
MLQAQYVKHKAAPVTGVKVYRESRAVAAVILNLGEWSPSFSGHLATLPLGKELLVSIE